MNSQTQLFMSRCIHFPIVLHSYIGFNKEIHWSWITPKHRNMQKESIVKYFHAIQFFFKKYYIKQNFTIYFACKTNIIDPPMCVDIES